MNSRTISSTLLLSFVLVAISLYLSFSVGLRRDRQLLFNVEKESVIVHIDGKKVAQFEYDATLGKRVALEFYEFFDHEKMSSWQQWLHVQVCKGNNDWRDVSFEAGDGVLTLSEGQYVCFDSGKVLSKQSFEPPFKLRTTFRWGFDGALGISCKDAYQGNWLYSRPQWNDLYLLKREHGKPSKKSNIHPYDDLTVSMMVNGIFYYFAHGLFSLFFLAAAIALFARLISPQASSIEKHLSALTDGQFIVLSGLVALTVYTAIASFAMHGITPFWDNQSYIFQARIFARGEFSAPAPPAEIRPHFDFSQIIVKDGRWFSKYILGYPIILSLGILIGNLWLVNVVLLFLSILVLFCLVRALAGSSEARLAVLLAIFSPYVCRWAIPTLSHTLSILFGLLVYYFLLVERRDCENKYALLAGFCAGAWACTRPYTALVLSVFPGLYRLWQRYDSRGWKSGLKCLCLMILGGIPSLLCLFYVNHVQMGDWHKFPFQAFQAREKLGFGQDRGWHPTFGSFGHTPAKAATNVYWSIRTVSHKLIGIPSLGGLVLFWAGLFFAKKRAPGFVLFSAFPILVLAYTLYFGAQGWRYYVDSSILLIAIGAAGLGAMTKSMAKAFPQYPVMRAAKLIFALTLVLMIFFLYRVNTRAESRWWRHNSALTRYLQENELKEPALVLMERTGDYVHTFEGLNLNDPWLHDGNIYAIDLGDNSALKRHFPQRHIYRWNGNMQYLGFSGKQ